MPVKNPKRSVPLTNLRWQIIYAAVVLGLFGAISVSRFGVGPRIGDGTGFYVMFFAWAENGTPYSNERVGEKFVEYTAARPAWEGQQHYYSPNNPMRRGGTADESHFWLYSGLAAIFYWPLKWLGADVGLSFNCLHVALLYVAVVLVHRRFGPAAALGLILIVVGSPALWYANKAHTELFTVVLGSLGAAYFVAQRHAAAAICFALVGTQNPAFGLVALLALAFGLASRGFRNFLADWKWLLVAGTVLALHPAYYWLRACAASPMLIGPELLFRTNLLPLKHMAAFWVDPDIGLLTTWPLALPLAIAGLAMFVQRRSRRRIEYAVFCLLASLMLTWSYARLANGFGGGGTVDVSRYSIWLIFLFFPLLWQVMVWLERQSRPMQRGAAVVGLALIGLSAWLYRPNLDEHCRRPTPLSTWLYANASGLYDPLPRIFYESRGGRREFTGEDVFRWRDWAVSDESGNKVLVRRDAFERQEADAPAGVVGRGSLDPQALYAVARDYFAAHPTAEFYYVNRRAAELFSPPPLAVEQAVFFTDHGDRARFLDEGWYSPEPNGTWSKGGRVEIIFAPTGVKARQNYAICLEVAETVGAGNLPLTISPLVNGVPLSPVEVNGPTVLRWPVSAERLPSCTRLVFMLRSPASPLQLGQGADTRQLGMKIAALRIQPLSPPPTPPKSDPTQHRDNTAKNQAAGQP